MTSKIPHYLLTGGAGFIGSHVAEKLLSMNCRITIVDNLDPFYDKSIKLKNLAGIQNNANATVIIKDILDEELYINDLQDHYDGIIHLAAKAGVRPSIANPLVYQDVNIKGTQYLLEFAKKKDINTFIFASSSSVYGVNKKLPWSESDSVLLPISPYASTKVSCELLGHVYSMLYNMRFIALRFFTVYGPRQRPDLAIHQFSKKLLAGKPLPFYGDGSSRRDYTFVDDIVDGVISALHYDQSNYEVFNLGNNQTISLSEMVQTIEETFGMKATLDMLPAQPGDVPITYASVDKANLLLGYKPRVGFKDGVRVFKDWLIQQ